MVNLKIAVTLAFMTVTRGAVPRVAGDIGLLRLTATLRFPPPSLSLSLPSFLAFHQSPATCTPLIFSNASNLYGPDLLLRILIMLFPSPLLLLLIALFARKLLYRLFGSGSA